MAQSWWRKRAKQNRQPQRAYRPWVEQLEARCLLSGTVLTGKGTTMAPAESLSFTHAVATFTDSNPADPASAFTATINWGDGTTGTGVVSGGNGKFTVTGTHTYADEGTDAVTVTLTQNAPGTATATANSTANVAEHDVLTAAPLTFTATQGVAFTGTVATFTNASKTNPPSDFTATINWGDGTTSTGTVSGSKGVLTVTDTHTYTDDGSFAVSVTLADDGTGTATATAQSAAIVPDSDATAAGTAITGTEGTAFSGTVATFSDPDSADAGSDLSATITWGDGSTSVGTVSGSAANGYTVSGTHTYADDGSFTAGVQITEGGSLLASATSTATVAESDLTLSGTSVAGSEGVVFTGTVATFTDPGSLNAASDFTATIQWGDFHFGGLTVSGSNGSFTISGTHKFADEGTFTATVYLNEKGTLLAQTTTSFTIAERDSLTGKGLTFTPIQNAPFTGVVANFTDTNLANNSADDFAATIDWGDGSTAAGTITFNGSGHFSVSGTHTYADPGTFTVTVTFADDDSGTASATAKSTAQVAPGNPLTPQSVTFAAAEGQPFTGTVAAFSDANTSDTAGNFSATIAWGDGSTSAGTVSGGNGSFIVSGTHTYANDDAYTAAVTLQFNNGSFSATANSSASVAESDATGTGLVLTATEGTAFAGAVATFSDPGSPDAVSELTALITWGDGSHSVGTVTGSNGSYTISGNHLYVDEGSFAVSVTLSETSVGVLTTASSTAAVAEGDSLTGTSLTLATTEGQVFSGAVATFTDTNAANTALGFAASIDWGDGTTSVGTVIEQAGTYVVLGSHTYADEGSFTATVTLSDPGAGTATAAAQDGVTVAEADALAAIPWTITAPPNKTFGITVATFTDTNPSNAASDFTATIDWGDGATSSGIVTGGTKGKYTVRGSHDYTTVGTFTVAVTLTDDGLGTATATADSTATIAVGNTVSSTPSGSSSPSSPSSGSGSSPSSNTPSGGTAGGSGATVYGDFNNDGYTDMAVGIPGSAVQGKAGAGAVEIFYGGPNGLSAAPNLILTENSAHVPKGSAAGDEFGFSLAVGDFNGDGFADVAVGAPFSAVGSKTAAGNIFIFYGSATGITTTGAQIFNSQSPGSAHFSAKNDQFGFALAAGDFNHDGFADLVIGCPNNTPNPPPTFKDILGGGTMFVLYGSAAGISTVNTKAFDQTTDGMNFHKELPYEHLSYTLAVGDFNGDGYADVAIGIPFRNLGSTQNITAGGAVAILYGGSAGLSVTGSQYFDLTSKGLAALDPEGGPQAGDEFSLALAAGDFNGAVNPTTGLPMADLAIGTPGDAGTVANAGAVYILYGSTTGLADTGAQRLTQASFGGTDQTGANFGLALAAGDFNGDGQADLAIGVPNATVNGVLNAGAVYAVYGSGGGLGVAGNQYWTQESLNNGSVSQAGDLFGSALAVGDFNGDGMADLAIGAPGKTIGAAAGAGAVDVVYGTSVGLMAVNDQFWDENLLGGTSNAGDGFGGAL
jgi:hypothetical protein